MPGHVRAADLRRNEVSEVRRGRVRCDADLPRWWNGIDERVRAAARLPVQATHGAALLSSAVAGGPEPARDRDAEWKEKRAAEARALDDADADAANDDAIARSDLSCRNLGTRRTPAAKAVELLAELELERQSAVIARKLAAGGYDASRQDGVVLIGALSGAILSEPRYRNCNIIPVIARRKRADLLSQVEFWSRRKRERCAPGLRYLVVTSGATVPLEGGEAEKRLRTFSGRLGKFAEWAKASFEVDLHLAAVEAPARRGEDGVERVHFHANVVYSVPYVLCERPSKDPERYPGTEWDRWLGTVRERFGTEQVLEGGEVRDVAQVVRYVTKPADILALSDTGTAALAHVLHRQKLVRTYGELREWTSDLKEAGKTVRRDDETGRLVLVKRRTKQEEQDAERAAIHEQAARAAKPCRTREEGKAGKPARTPENAIMFVASPQARRCLIKEPLVGVRGYTPNPVTPEGEFGLARLQDIRDEAVNRLRAKGVRDDAMEWACASMLDSRTFTPLAHVSLPDLSPEQAYRLCDRLGLINAGFTVEAIVQTSAGRMAFCAALERRLGGMLDGPRHPFPPVSATLRDDAEPEPARTRCGRMRLGFDALDRLAERALTISRVGDACMGERHGGGHPGISIVAEAVPPSSLGDAPGRSLDDLFAGYDEAPEDSW